MIVYSQKIFKFINEIKIIIKQVLAREVGVKVVGNRFFDADQRYSYPICVVIYNNKSMLGYFDPNFYEFGFHESLMYSNKELLANIIRHEIAHFFFFIKYGGGYQPHCNAYKALCQQFGWGEAVFKATTCVDDGTGAAEIEESPVLRKIKKLMALSTSSNAHEAEQAIIKSQELLLKHNIDSKYVVSNDEEKMYLKRIMRQKRENAKMCSIANILETFFVHVILQRGAGDTYLEILGTKDNIEIAEYVACVLDKEFEKLWKHAQKTFVGLKGMIAKNSFFIGIAKGYCDKVHHLRRSYSSDVNNALMVLEKQLVDVKDLVYPRLSSSRSNGSYCSGSSAIGEMMGKNLNIHHALKGSSKETEALIGYVQ